MIPSGEVTIPTFVNPHLFWIIPNQNSERNGALTKIEQLMTQICRKPDLNTTFDIGEIVAVQIDHRMYRAVIEDEDNSLNLITERISYICWLIDYGILVKKVHDIYKLPASIRRTPPLAYQASLNNVVYFTEDLSFNDKGRPVKGIRTLLSPVPVSRQVSVRLLGKCVSLKFHFEMKEDGIFFGDILYKIDENCEYKSFTEYLIENSVVMEAPDLFDEAKKSINHYRECNLRLIENICLHSSGALGSGKVWTEEDGDQTFSANEEFENDNVKPNRSISSDTITTSDSERVPNPSTFMKNLILREKLKKNTEDLKNKSSNKEKLCFSPGGASFSLKPSPKQKHVKFDETRLGALKQVSRIKLVESSTDFNSEESELESKNERRKFNKQLQKQTESSSGDECAKKKSDQWSSSENLSSGCNETQKSDIDNVKTLNLKPHCKCFQCLHWTDETDWQSMDNFHETKTAKVKLCIGNLSLKLFKNHDDDDNNKNNDESNEKNVTQIISLDYSSMTKIQKQITRKILIHGESLPTPVKGIANVNFHQLVIQSLEELGYKEAKRIQSYTWPMLFRNQHVFMINGPRTGKSMAYLPVLCTFILEKSGRYNFHNKATGAPIVMILCSNSRKCEDIYDLILVLMGKGKARISLITYPTAHVNTSHIDVLITTPLLLIDLLKNNAINMKRLCHFVLEDGDTTLKRFKLVIDKIMNVIQSTLSTRLDPRPVQLIICAEHWTKHIASIHKRLHHVPFVCIGNFIEAALYGKVRISIEFMNSACKEMKLKTLLKDTFSIQRSIIVCKKQDIDDIEQFLMLKGISTTTIKEDMSKEEVIYLENMWDSTAKGEHTVLICTDFQLNTMLSITSAALLIHYSLPSSWTKFVQRFSCLLENCQSPLNEQPTAVSQSVVLCDETCIEQMRKFFKYLHSVELKNQTDIWKECAQEAQMLEEKEKLDTKVGVCNNLKLFGTCNELNCAWRHLLDKDLDFSKNLPHCGKIRFKILNVHDVTNFSIRILKQSNPDDNPMKITQELTDTLMMRKRNAYHFIHGHWYAYKDEETFQRCEFIDRDGDEDVAIKLIESGQVLTTAKTNIYALPREFDSAHRPREAIDMYLANLLPPYQDDNFSAKAFYNLKTLMDKNDYKNIIFTGDIYLQLAGAIWLKDVHEEVKLADKVIYGFQLSREIIQRKLAIINDEQLTNLTKLCKEAEIDVAEYKLEPRNNNKMMMEKQVKPQWAHFNSDEIEEVFFCCAVTPDEFYVRLCKFYKLGESLQKEIQENIQKSNYPDLIHFEEGTICLAKDPEETEYERAIVLKIENDKVLVFFADGGYDAVLPRTNLKYIRNEHITKLPFQSIRCSLRGLKPIMENEWEDDAINMLYQYATEPKSDIFRSLFVKVTQKNPCGLLEQNSYTILLKDGYGHKNALINSLMIDCGFALSNGDEICDFDIGFDDYQGSDEDEELAFVADGYKRTEVMGKGDNVDVGHSREDYDYSDDDGDYMDFILNDPAKFFAEFRNFGASNTQVSSNNNTQTPQMKPELPAIQAAPEVNYCTPEVLWSQKNDSIRIVVKLPGVENYKLTVMKGRSLQFITVVDQKTYKLSLMLFDLVKLEQHAIVGPEIRIKLIKNRNNIEWPRLLSTTQRARYIRYDFEAMKDTEEDQRKRFLQLPKDLDDEHFKIENEDDIDLMYHNVSDMDSDFDQDIEFDLD